MTWDEHEKEYCLTVEPRQQDIHDTFKSYCDAENYIYHYEAWEENIFLGFVTTRWDGKYYVVTRLSNEDYDYYK